jgi:hypothetical protein
MFRLQLSLWLVDFINFFLIYFSRIKDSNVPPPFGICKAAHWNSKTTFWKSKSCPLALCWLYMFRCQLRLTDSCPKQQNKKRQIYFKIRQLIFLGNDKNLKNRQYLSAGLYLIFTNNCVRVVWKKQYKEVLNIVIIISLFFFTLHDVDQLISYKKVTTRFFIFCFSFFIHKSSPL